MVLFFGLCASVFVVLLSFTIQRKNVVLVSSALACFTMAQYMLLGKTATVVLAAVTLLYGVVTLFEKRYPVLGSKYALYVLCATYSAVFFLVNGFSFDVEILAYAASLAGVIIMALRNQIAVKWIMLLNGATWCSYQLIVGAYGQLPGEIFFTVGVLVSLKMLYDAKKKGVPLDKVPEVSTILKNKFNNFRETRQSSKIAV